MAEQINLGPRSAAVGDLLFASLLSRHRLDRYRLVALTRPWDLFDHARDLFVYAKHAGPVLFINRRPGRVRHHVIPGVVPVTPSSINILIYLSNSGYDLYGACTVHIDGKAVRSCQTQMSATEHPLTTRQPCTCTLASDWCSRPPQQRGAPPSNRVVTSRGRHRGDRHQQWRQWRR